MQQVSVDKDNREADLNQLIERVESSFEKQFQRPPKWVSAAPGRVNLIGEHTDYNDGFVFPMAIERNIVLAADEASDQGDDTKITIYSQNLGDAKTLVIKNQQIARTGSWTDYIAGIFAGFIARGIEFKSLNIALDGDVPMGGGLSSSAALEVATATLLETISGVSLSPIEKVLLCQKAEHDYAGVPCGIMDQFASVNGKKDHLLLLDCQSQQAENVPFNHPDYSILIIDSNVKHSLASGEYGRRRAECEQAVSALGVDSLRSATMEQLNEVKEKLDVVVYRRARHVISEIERTTQAAHAMKTGQWERLGQLMLASHASLRDDYEVSCEELDLLVELVMSVGGNKGVVGSRMTGGGFGGCTVSLVPTNAINAVKAEVNDAYYAKTGIKLVMFTTRPAQGARMIKT